jgi:hypothetical protein
MFSSRSASSFAACHNTPEVTPFLVFAGDPRASSRQSILGTAALTPGMLLFVAPFPFVVLGAYELRRWVLRRRRASRV